MKYLLALFISLAFVKGSPIILKRSIPANDTSLKSKQAAMDQYLYKHQKSLIVLAKITGKNKLVSVQNENWPDKMEYIYNILKDSKGKIIMIAQIPYSESGDWYIEYKNYFDENGRTFAFSKRETVFDDSVNEGMAMEELFEYYDAGFKNIGQIKKLTDKDEKAIKRNKNEFDFREYKYTVYKNVKECMAGYNIKLIN